MRRAQMLARVGTPTLEQPLLGISAIAVVLFLLLGHAGQLIEHLLPLFPRLQAFEAFDLLRCRRRKSAGLGSTDYHLRGELSHEPSGSTGCLGCYYQRTPCGPQPDNRNREKKGCEQGLSAASNADFDSNQ